MSIYASPIGFSQSMMAANIAGRKSQTRRLPSASGAGPWMHLLYAFEAECRECVLWVKERVDRTDHLGAMEHIGTYTIDGADIPEPWPFKTSFVTHLPRRWSRFVCVVRGVRSEPLQDISDDDAIAEGIEPVPAPPGNEGQAAWKSYETYPDGTPHPHATVPNRSPVTSYRELWNSLHTKPGQRWDDNPMVWVIEYEWKAQRINDLLSEELDYQSIREIAQQYLKDFLAEELWIVRSPHADTRFAYTPFSPDSAEGKSMGLIYVDRPGAHVIRNREECHG